MKKILNHTLTHRPPAGKAERLLTMQDVSEEAGALATACASAVRDAEQCNLSDSGSAETATALRDTVHELLGLFAEIFDQEATVSKHGITGQPTGLALEFVQIALEVRGIETSEENILRILKQNGEPEA